MKLPRNAIIRDGEVYVLRKSRKRGFDENKGLDKVCIECAFFDECDTTYAPCEVFNIGDIDSMNFQKLMKGE